MIANELEGKLPWKQVFPPETLRLRFSTEMVACIVNFNGETIRAHLFR